MKRDQQSVYEEFSIPGTGGNYAPEIIYSRVDQSEGGVDFVDRLSVYVDSLPTSAEIEVDLKKPGEPPHLAASWLTNVITISSDGLSGPHELVAGQIRIRGKSGGTSGTAPVLASWDS